MSKNPSLVSVISALSISVGGLVLVGWALDIAALKSILPGWVSMKPNTAVAFVLIGIALLSLSSERLQGRLFCVARLCGWLAGVIGLLTLVEYISGWNPGFDQWLFPELAATVGTSNPGRMAPDTALCFVLLAAGLETVRVLRQRSLMLIGTAILGVLVMTMAAAAISTYFTPAFGAFGWCGLTNMAVPTAALFAVLGVALILLAWQTGDLNWSLGQKSTAAYAGGLMMVVLLGLHTSRSALWQSETASRVEHGERVLTIINDIEAENAKAQAHTRGFVITGEDRYLQSQQVAAGRCRAKLAELRQFVIDPAQQARSARLEVQVNELLQWYPQVIEARSTSATETVRRNMVNHGEDLMDGVRASIMEIEQAEQRLLQKGHQRAQDVARFTQMFISTGTLVSLIALLLVLSGLNRAETVRQQALETLEASEIRYRRLFEAARDGVLIFDAETGMVVDVNPYLIELLGVTYEVFLGKKVWELGFFTDLIANEANFAELQQKGYVRYDDMALEGHDGKRHEVEFISNVYLVNGRKVIQCNIRDISERVRAAAVLRASEENYRMLFREMQNGFALHEMICDEAGNPSDYRFLAVNPAFERMTGLKAVETVGRTVLEILPDTERSWIERYGKVALTGESVRFENVAASMKKHFEVVAFCPKNKQFACVFTDITERKQAETALREAKALTDAIVEHMPLMAFLKEATDLRFVVFNRAGEELLGYDRKALLGKNNLDLFPPEQAAHFMAKDREALAAQGIVDIPEERIQTAKRGERLLHTRKVCIRGGDGKTKYLLGISEDITDHRRAETEIENEQALSNAIIEGIPGTFYMLDENGKYVRWSAYQRDEIVGKPDAEVSQTFALDTIHPDDRALILSKIENVFKNEVQEAVEGRVLLRGGPAFVWMLMTGRKIVLNGRPFLVGIGIDITERKHAEAEHAKLQMQFAQAQKMESVGRLAGGVAHDFNNLLMGMMGYVQLCLDKIVPDHPIREYLDEITHGAERSAAITRQLLAFARKQTIAPRVLDLNDAVASMLKLLQRLIGEDIKLAWRPGVDLRPVKLDPSQIDQILANLCVNSRDAIDGVGEITLETGNSAIDAEYCARHKEAIPGAYVFLAVSDNGCGMDKETLAQVFEPFFTTKGLGKGTGLGLATVYGIVKQNNGFIYAYSEPGKGTTFKIYLPEIAAETVAATVTSKAEASRGRGETILLVEDEKSLRVTCGAFLDALGYKVLEAETPGEAMKMVAGHPGDIHVLLTDVVMPGMDGRQLAKRISAVKPNVKVLFMSGYTSDVIAQRGVLDEGVQFLSKPFTRDDLARKVHEMLVEDKSSEQ